MPILFGDKTAVLIVLLPTVLRPLQVSRTAKMMITQGGFSKKLGQIAWSGGNQNTFVGQQMGQPSDCSGETSDEIDQEVKALVDRAYRYPFPFPLSHFTLPDLMGH